MKPTEIQEEELSLEIPSEIQKCIGGGSGEGEICDHIKIDLKGRSV